MYFLDALSLLKKSKIFIEWMDKHKESFLSYGFLMLDKSVKEEWQIGYYDTKSERVTTFVISDVITANPPAEVFGESKVLEIDPLLVEINIDKAINIADKLQAEKYNSHVPSRKIAIIQNLEIGQVWNITFVTKTFKALNIKIDSASGVIVSDSLLDFFKIDS